MDTGGYNIKTRMMELMKFDCGGAAAVLGAARAIALLAPEDVEVHIVVAACEVSTVLRNIVLEVPLNLISSLEPTNKTIFSRIRI